jgi:hypothetical protein
MHAKRVVLPVWERFNKHHEKKGALLGKLDHAT